jgi:pimeloyl-ACP methyl ester carboxylesterase
MRTADQYALAALTGALATREDITGALAEASVPLLLLAGDEDPRLHSIRRTAAEIPAATLAELPGCGHLDAFLRTDLTLPSVRHFLAENR